MIRFVAVVLCLAVVSTQAHADAFNDCSQKKDLDRQISGCSRYIDDNNSSRVLQVWEYVTAAIGARGHAYRSQGKHDLAIKDFTRVIKRKRSVAPVALLNRAISYEAIGARDQAIGDYQEIVQFLKNNPHKKPEYGRHAAHAAKALARLGTAPKTKTSAGKSAPKSTKLALKQSQDAYARGVGHRKKREYDKAIAEHTKAIKLNPKNAAAYLDRGIAYDLKGQDLSAIDDFSEAIRLRPKSASAYLRRGLLYYQTGQYKRAITDFTMQIKTDPQNIYGYNNRGRAYRKDAQYDRAITDHTQVIKLKPKFAFAYNDRGHAYYKKGDFVRAMADLDEAIKLNPKLASAYRNRGNVYARLGKYKEADAEFSKANKIDPKGVMTIPTKVKPAKKVKPAPAKKATGGNVSNEMDLAFWNDVKDSNDSNMLQAYLDQFPQGVFASLAKLKIQKLKKAQ